MLFHIDLKLNFYFHLIISLRFTTLSFFNLLFYIGIQNGYPLKYSCLENFRDRGAQQATVHGVAELDMTKQLTHLVNLQYWVSFRCG